MKTSIINRFSPLTLRTGTVLSNRVVVAPMASETADTEGFVTDKTLAHSTRLGESQTGFIFVEYSFVHESGKSEENQLGIANDLLLDGLKDLSKKIHASESKAGIQLTHLGEKTESRFTGGILQSPSGVIVPVKDRNQVSANEFKMITQVIRDYFEGYQKADTIFDQTCLPS